MNVPGPDLHGHVVVGFDGSPHATDALSWAADQATLERRPLTIISAGRESNELVERANAGLRESHPTVQSTVERRDGDPRRVLLDASSSARLLVLGSRGRGTLKTMLLGSVSSNVSARAMCPVVICRPSAESQLRGGVVVGADGTPESRGVLDFAYRQASLRDLHLTVVHSFWEAAAALAQYRMAQGRERDVAATEFEELRILLSESVAGFREQYPEVRVTLSLHHGLTDEVLSPRGSAWELIVVGRHPVSTLQRLLTGSVSSAVLERAHSPVAIVPEGDGT